MKKYILFDLDGTLTDSQDGIMNSILYCLDSYGIKVEERAQLKRWLGPPLRDSLMKYYGFDKETALEGVKKYREYFDRKGFGENRVYDGIEQMLMRLKDGGHSLMIATSKPENAAVRIAKHFDIAKYFDFIGGATESDERVQKADVIRYVLDTNRIEDLSQVIMVGDREHDVHGALANQLEVVGVRYGYSAPEELEAAGATYVVDTVSELESLLMNL